MLEGTSKDHQVQPSKEKRAFTLCTLSSCILKTSTDGGSASGVVLVIDYSHCKKYLSFVKVELLMVQLVPVAPSLCDFLWRESLHPLCRDPLSAGILRWGQPESSSGWKDMILSIFPHMAGSPALQSSSWPPLDPLLVLFELQNQNWTMCRLPGAEQSGVITSLSLLVMPLQKQLRNWLTFVAAVTSHIQLVVHQHLQVPFTKAVPQPHRSKPVLDLLVMLSQVQDLALC